MDASSLFSSVSVSVCPLSLSLSDSKILPNSAIAVNSNHLSLKFGLRVIFSHLVGSVTVVPKAQAQTPRAAVILLTEHQLDMSVGHGSHVCVLGEKPKLGTRVMGHFPPLLIEYNLPTVPWSRDGTSCTAVVKEMDAHSGWPLFLQ